ncbi:hypothetical protein F5888DRAFT_1631697 [Russula emetica]|nr:hypothetical protein F5888DRAFT_1631697 [Russula emetica]
MTGEGPQGYVKVLVDYIYTTLGLNLDYVIPFAAVPKNGCEINGLDDKSELTHCIILVNLLHLLGAIKTRKSSQFGVTSGGFGHITNLIDMASCICVNMNQKAKLHCAIAVLRLKSNITKKVQSLGGIL